ncbi:hypothetical protein CDAR_394131 [Caerostris darwini]|uniref:Uncharacterized protein n=1 Tax=Caerostris darwini TaxID=1538125 RepID=A0AAV4RDG3_9ARAC|nr:hypothetical protein CDAR_394131 [Caerostris darwini]
MWVPKYAGVWFERGSGVEGEGAVENNGTIPFQRSHSPQPPSSNSSPPILRRMPRCAKPMKNSSPRRVIRRHDRGCSKRFSFPFPSFLFLLPPPSLNTAQDRSK